MAPCCSLGLWGYFEAQLFLVGWGLAASGLSYDQAHKIRPLDLMSSSCERGSSNCRSFTRPDHLTRRFGVLRDVGYTAPSGDRLERCPQSTAYHPLHSPSCTVSRAWTWQRWASTWPL